MTTMADPQFIADMKKQRFELDPVNGDELQKIVGNVADVPKDLADKAEQALLVKQDAAQP